MLDMVNAYLHFTTAQIAIQHHKYSRFYRPFIHVDSQEMSSVNRCNW
jgi:hypothetical protein